MDLPIRLPEQLGTQLKSLRKHRRLSQGELGARLGVSQGRIAQIEAQPGSVSLDQILRVLQALGAEMLVRPLPEAADVTVSVPPADTSTPGQAALRESEKPATPSTGSLLFRPAPKGSW